MLRVLQGCRIKAAVRFDEAWKWRWDSVAALMEAVSNPNPNSGSEMDSDSDSHCSSSNIHIHADAEADCNAAPVTCSSLTSVPSPDPPSSFRIGRLLATTVDDDRTIRDIINSRRVNGEGEGEVEVESVFMQHLMSAYLPTTVGCIIFEISFKQRFLSCSLPHHITQLCIERFDPHLPRCEMAALMA